VLQASQAAAGVYAAATQTATFAVAGQAQTITFTAPVSPVNYGVAPIALSATASSGLAVRFSVVSGPASVSGSTLTITGAGTVVVAADQAGNTTYSAAPQVTRSITVNKVAPTVGITASPAAVLAQNPVTLTATVASSLSTPTGSVVFADGSTTLGSPTLSGGTASLNVSTLAVGSHSITASYSGDGNFNALASSTVTVTVQDFTVTVGGAGASQTISVGGSATYTFPVGLSGGAVLPSAVTFTASGLPPGATATFSPASLPAGSAATTVTMTIQVTKIAMLEKTGRPETDLPVIAFAALFLPFFIRRKGLSGRWPARVVLMVTLLAGFGATAMVTGCGGSSTASGTNQTGTYTVSVTATSGSLSHVTTVTLIVQ
jgi:hypothetical protein